MRLAADSELRRPTVCTCSTCPPFALPLVELEHVLLAAIIVTPALIAQLPSLEVEDFTRYQHRAVFSAIRNLQCRGEPITVESLHEYMVQLDIVRGSVCRLHAGDMYLRALVRVTPLPHVDVAHAKAFAAVLQRERWDREIAAKLETREGHT